MIMFQPADFINLLKQEATLRNNNKVSTPGMKMMDGHMMPADDSIAMMMMQMTFYAGVDCTVLIKQWKVNKTVLQTLFCESYYCAL